MNCNFINIKKNLSLSLVKYYKVVLRWTCVENFKKGKNMAMQDNKVVYSSTNDFLRYISIRQEEKEKEKTTRFSSLKSGLKKSTKYYKYN